MNALITQNLSTLALAVQNKSASGRGSSKKIDLYGIKKLRELILELAVRGKLVPQNPEDEPASKLLERIEAEKARLVKEKLVKKQKALPEVAEEEQSFKLPFGWSWTRLAESYDVRDGTHDTPKYLAEGVPLVTSKNISSGRLDLSDIKYISEADHQKISERSKVECNDILFAMIGSIGNPVIVDTATQFSIKNVALFKYYEQSLSCPHFLLIFLKYAESVFRAEASGAVQSFVSLGKIRSFSIALPPLAEQHRIVTKVDELMALCDQIEQQTEASLSAHTTLVENLLATLINSTNAEELKQNWQRIASHFTTLFTTEASIDQLKQTILQLAVMGKLVSQDPSDEPAAKLLERIAAEKAQLVKEGKIKKQKPLPPIAEDEKLFELPDGWEWANLTELFALVTDGDHQAPPKAESGIPFLVIGNLNTGNVLFTNCKFVPESYYSSLDWGRQPVSGDLLYTVTGSFGIPIKVDTSEPFCVQRHVAILKVAHSTPARYFKLLLASKYAYEYAAQVATGIAQKTVPLSGLRKMPVPVPSITEQHRIVAKVDELITLCNQIKTHLQHQQQTRLHLADAMVAQALNPTNPNSPTQPKAANP